MTELKWDEVGERRYQTGVDHGVIYLRSGIALPWNGLTQITEKTGREVKAYYLDGQKYLAKYVPGTYEATLEAFTYPDELDTLLGMSEFAPGVFLHDQSAGMFDLSYRTLIGNDTEGEKHGYKIHVLYNILATPSDVGMSTISDRLDIKPFQWTLTGTPANLFGARPTSHISLDSTRIDEEILGIVENVIYGTGLTDPTLPSLIELMNLVTT